jgi:hypothetical protein
MKTTGDKDLISYINEYESRLRNALRAGALRGDQKQHLKGELHALSLIRDEIRGGATTPAPAPRATPGDQHTILTMARDAGISEQVVRYILRGQGFRPTRAIGRTHLYSDDVARAVVEHAKSHNQIK